jgi:hypothetical protein
MGRVKKKRYEVIIGTSYEIEAETPEEAEEEAMSLFEEDTGKAMAQGESLADWGSVDVKELKEKGGE